MARYAPPAACKCTRPLSGAGCVALTHLSGTQRAGFTPRRHPSVSGFTPRTAPQRVRVHTADGTPACPGSHRGRHPSVSGFTPRTAPQPPYPAVVDVRGAPRPRWRTRNVSGRSRRRRRARGAGPGSSSRRRPPCGGCRAAVPPARRCPSGGRARSRSAAPPRWWS